jgi:lysophospholipase L1-like esterase
MIGLPRYRHGLVLLDSTGPWHRMPASPAGTRPRQDGELGLAGLVAVPGDASSSASVRLRDADWARGRLRWEVVYRLRSADAAFDLRAEGESAERIVVGLGATRASGISSFVLETEGAAEIHVERFAGELDLLGVIVERLKPGLVFDTLGINGARAATPLSWDEAAWIDEVRARAPALVVLSYGTNEVGDVASADTYRAHYTALVRRLRLAAPEADCLIVGPTDRARPDWQTNPRVSEIQEAQKLVAGELGCAFFSPFEAMGGPGSLRRWAFENPPRARRDRVHLTLRGYQTLGSELANRLFESFEAVYEGEP